jgi:signal transduction histidine kinase
MFHFFSRLKLRIKFSLIIIGLVIAIISVVLYLVYSQQAQSILAEVETRALDLTTTLAFAGVRASLEDNYLVLQELVDSISHRGGIRQVMVVDTTGRILAHNHTGERGKVYQDSLSQLAVRSLSPVVSTYALGKENVKDVAAPIIVSGRKVATARVIVSLDSADRAIEETARQILFIGSISAVGALIAAAFLSGLVIKPLKRLYHNALQISRGDREIQINVTAQDEIGTVQRALKTMVDEVRLKARLAALGTTTANLAHEIRTPLAVIMRYITDFTAKEQDPQLLAAKSQKALAEINRLNDLVKQLLLFSQNHKLVRSRANINALIEQALFLVEGQLKERRINVTQDFAALPAIAADKNLLQSVFANLISNAIDAMDEEGALHIQTKILAGQSDEPSRAAANGKLLSEKSSTTSTPLSRNDLPQKATAPKPAFNRFLRLLRIQTKRFFIEPNEQTQRIPLQPTIPEKEAIVIAITDNGHGIPAELMDQLFLPFFTTKRSGTGLGLALSHKIIQEHQGAIHVESEEGKGTTFKITLPV